MPVLLAFRKTLAGQAPYKQTSGPLPISFYDTSNGFTRYVTLYFIDPSTLTYGGEPGQTSFGSTSLWTFANSGPSAITKVSAYKGLLATPNVYATGTIYASGGPGNTEGFESSDGDLTFDFQLDEPFASNNTGNYYNGTSGGYCLPGNLYLNGVNGYPSNLPIIHCEIPYTLQNCVTLFPYSVGEGPIPCTQYAWAGHRALIAGDYYIDVQHAADDGSGYWAEIHAVRYILFLS
jgi:hypothetical protein